MSLALIIGVSTIYVLGIDGFASLLRDESNLYANEFLNRHYKAIANTDEAKKEHLRIREPRDMADRYIFSQIPEYCKGRGIGLFLLNRESHLHETLPLASEEMLI